MNEPSYFFDQGLKFECTGCGACCSGEPGQVYMNEGEVAKLAAFLNEEVAAVKERDLYQIDAGYGIKERNNGDCYYLKDNKCSVHSVRPTQCRTYPFWWEVMRSENKWQKEAEFCPGIGLGKKYSKEEILTILGEDLER